LAHYESWLADQAVLTTAGPSVVRPNRIVLELDGDTYATWSIETKDLTEVVRSSIVKLGETLSKGNHQGRLTALDDAGQTLAVIPVTVRGTNTAATNQVDGNVQMQRAVTLMVGNIEALCHTMRDHAELTSKGYQDALGQNLMLTETLQGLVAAKSEQSAAAEERLARSRRMDQLFERFIPMLELGLGCLAAEVEKRYSDKNKLPASPPVAPPPPPPPPPDPMPADIQQLCKAIFGAELSPEEVRKVLSGSDDGGGAWDEVSYYVRRAFMKRSLPYFSCSPALSDSLFDKAVSDIRTYAGLKPPVLIVPNHLEPTSSSEVVDLASFDAQRSCGGSAKRKPSTPISAHSKPVKKTPAPKRKR
jgi:hypothetical protein